MHEWPNYPEPQGGGPERGRWLSLGRHELRPVSVG